MQAHKEHKRSIIGMGFAIGFILTGASLVPCSLLFGKSLDVKSVVLATFLGIITLMLLFLYFFFKNIILRVIGLIGATVMLAKFVWIPSPFASQFELVGFTVFICFAGGAIGALVAIPFRYIFRKGK